MLVVVVVAVESAKGAYDVEVLAAHNCNLVLLHVVATYMKKARVRTTDFNVILIFGTKKGRELCRMAFSSKM